jgi:hypothetical protein
MALLVRLKPYNERKGHKTRTYMIDGARFFEERGWYEVSDSFGEKLRALKQDHYETDPDAPKLFDVCSPGQATALEEAETAAEIKATVRKPATLISSRVEQRAESGDLKSTDFTAPAPAPVSLPPMVDPDPDGAELADDSEADVGRVVQVGRVGGGKSVPPPPKTRTRRP